MYGRKEIDVGDVYVYNTERELRIEIYTDRGWKIKETHVRISKDSLEWTPPERWPYKHELKGKKTYDRYAISLEEIGHGKYGKDPPFGVSVRDTIFLAVHVDLDDETAYASSFKGYNEIVIYGTSIFESYSLLKSRFLALAWKFLEFQLYDIYPPKTALRLAVRMLRDSKMMLLAARRPLSENDHSMEEHEHAKVLVAEGNWMERYVDSFTASYLGFKVTLVHGTDIAKLPPASDEI